MGVAYRSFGQMKPMRTGIVDLKTFQWNFFRCEKGRAAPTIISGTKACKEGLSLVPVGHFIMFYTANTCGS